MSDLGCNYLFNNNRNWFINFNFVWIEFRRYVCDGLMCDWDLMVVWMSFINLIKFFLGMSVV